MPATTLEKVYNFFQNKPIDIKDFDELYVNADTGRGTRIFKRLKRLLLENSDRSLKILFAGHRGCGKTTELVRLQKAIDKNFIILNFSVAKELDTLNINYIELFIVTMEKLFELVERENIAIDDLYLKNITEWLKSKEIEEVREKHLGSDIEAGIESGVDIPFLAKFFGRFKAAAKASSSMKTTLKTNVEPKLSELIWHCNRLLFEIRSKFGESNKKDLLIIIEDLDKVPMDKAEDIFYSHSNQLTQLNCHCIFTFPISLLYHIRFKTISNNYNVNFVLPMIKVAERNGGECTEGINIMEDIVKQRMNLSLFEDNAILKDMIKKSGGCLWDLFRMIRDAADNALDFDRTAISKGDYESAYKMLKADYERTIAENKEKGIKVDAYYKELRACAADEDKKPEYTDVMLDLMNNLTVLNYNGDNWSDVHPVVKDILEERKLIRNG